MALTRTETFHVSPWKDIDFEWYKGNIAQFMADSPMLNANLNKKLFINALNPAEFVTGKQLLDYTRKAAYVLRNKYGIRDEDVVCLFAFNNVMTPAIHHGILSLGAVVSPANIAYLPSELHHQLNISRAKLIITEESHLAISGKATKDFTPTCVENIITINQFIKDIKAATENEIVTPLFIKPEDVATKHAYYCFSSGTSGAAKGVVTSHYNMTSNILQMRHVSKIVCDSVNLFGCVLPMSHIFGLTLYTACMPSSAYSSVIFRQFDFELLLQKICELDINFVQIVPPMAVLFAKHPLVDKYPAVKQHLQTVMSGAAPLSKSLAHAVTARVGVKVFQAYGLTETSPVSHFFTYDLETYDLSNVGWLVPGMEARLVDEDGNEITDFGTPGELWLKGPNVMRQYLRNPEATAGAFADDLHDWFKTGDVGVVYPDGQYAIVDRFKELIKSKGHQVAPAELEALILTHPNVADTAVIGFHVPDEGTEYPRAFVVFKKKQDPLEFKKWFDVQVARHKQLWGGVVVVDEIPKSPSGKILRRFLRGRKGDVAHGFPAAKVKL